MAITYGPHGGSFAVWLGSKVMQRCRTEEGARSAATKLSARFGGGVMKREAPPAAPDTAPSVVLASEPDDSQPPPDFHLILGLSIPKLRERLAAGDLDEHLVALDAAERGAGNRKGALDAIADRSRLARATA